MKKLITLLVFLQLSVSAYSQGIGDSYYDAMKALTNNKTYYNIKFNNDGDTYNNISAENDFGGYIYFFPKEGDWQRRCALIALIPGTREKVFDFIEYLNKTYVVINDKAWDFYRQDGMVVRVELKTVDNLLVFYYFPKSL